MTEIFKEQELIRNLISSFLLLTLLIVIRAIVVRYLTQSEDQEPSEKRTWLVHVNNLFTILLVLGLVVVWAAKLQAFAFSIVAIAAAIVIATKELILCLLGGIYKSMVRPFKVGDRIEVFGFRGEVIDHTFLSIEVLEIGPGKGISQYTGKSIEIPNSLLLSNPVIKEIKSALYRLHTFSVVQPLEIDIEKHKEILEEAAISVCREYLSDAKSYMDGLQKEEGLEAPSVDPRVSITFTAKDSVEFTIRIPVPSLRGAKVQQEVLMQYVRKIKQIDTEAKG